MFTPDFGNVQFANENCTMEFTIMDGKPMTGAILTHNKSLIAPKGTACWDGVDLSVQLSFEMSAASFDNWEELKRVTDEMEAFFKEFKEKYKESFFCA